MTRIPETISPHQLGGIIAESFKEKESINCYVGSNAATPTTLLESLTDAVKADSPRLPFIRMLHVLLQGPIPYLEKGLQDRIMAYSIFSGGDVRKAANRGHAYYLPCTLANIDGLIGYGRKYQTDVVLMKVSQNPHTGEYSLGLSVEALHTAIDHARVVVAELDSTMPFTEGQSVIDAGSIDYLVEENVKPVYTFDPPDFDNLPHAERRIGELIVEHFIQDGVTLQTGIGKIPDSVIGIIKDSNFKDLGVQTELYGDGLMLLQKMGIINNRRKTANRGYSTTSLIMGSRDLYDFCHMRSGVQMRPCGYTNGAEIIRRNNPFISINTAIGVDLFGNVWADFIDPRKYYSGVGGQPDFIRAITRPEYGAAIIAVKSITNKGQSKIVPHHPAGVTLTASSYDDVVIVTEYGIADLRGLTTGNKAVAIACIAHPKFRDDLLKQVVDDPFFTKPHDFKMDRVPYGVSLYEGRVPEPEVVLKS